MDSLHAPVLDISVVTYNSARWLEPFMRSLLKQELPCSGIRLLFRDNGSSDETMARLQAIAQQHAGAFAQIEIDAGDNIGFGRGHNANLEKAMAPWLMVTNVDLEFEPQTLPLLIQRASTAPAEVAAWECRQKPYEHPKHYNPVTGEVAWASSACVLYRSAALRDIAGYEPRLFLYGEDVEISYRLRDRGWVLHYVPQATVWHFTYEHAAQVKPAQFLGSTLANVLLRCRYGRWAEVVQGFLMYLGLFAMKPQFPGQRRQLALNGLNLLRLAPYFLSTRKRSALRFDFRLWDYEMTRHGAFHEYPVIQGDVEQPLVSVLIRTVAGRGGKLAEALASVANQTYARIEVVIVEDGSATAAPVADRLRESGRFAGVVYKGLAKVGRCEAGNAALALAGGDLFCFLDDDDLFYADHLEVLVQALRGQPELGGAYSLSYQVRTEVISDEPWRYQEIEHSLLYRQPFSRALLWHHNYLPIQTVLFRRKLYDSHGGFDAELDNLEDWNLWVRYTLEQDFVMVDKVTSLYRVPAHAERAVQRQQVLDDYYAKAVAKHADLRVTLNPNQVVAMGKELAHDLYFVAVPRSGLRNAVLSRPWLARFYHPLRRMASLARRVARRI
ncbi:MAG: glycosyltransferase family 2 protein [Burkholderiaceae bacterium]|nr:glycosyltransferase family 2 protein [Burkholderiaceae bacterium]